MSNKHLRQNTPPQSQIQRQTAAVIQQTYQGPIPDPSTLVGYQNIDPTFPERIIAMAEREQQHRHEQNAFITAGNDRLNASQIQLIDKRLNNERIGTGAGLVSVFLVVGLCAYTLYQGYPTQAATIATVVIVSLATVFVLRKSSTSKEDDIVQPTNK